ncbi:hypothetical protein ACIKT0_08385 [Hansschlegelia beijingensis]
MSAISNPFLTYALGGVSGFAATRFTMTKAEKSAVSQKKYENSVKHKKDKEDYANKFAAAMAAYVNKPKDELKLDDLITVANSGNMYFNELRIISDAILGGHIDASSRDRTFVPDIHEALMKTIPQYYKTINAAAEKLGVRYGGEYKEENYESLIAVAEKYGTTRTAASSPSTTG